VVSYWSTLPPPSPPPCCHHCTTVVALGVDIVVLGAIALCGAVRTIAIGAIVVVLAAWLAHRVGVASWRGGIVARWCRGEVALWRGGVMARWCCGEMASWQGASDEVGGVVICWAEAQLVIASSVAASMAAKLRDRVPGAARRGGNHAPKKEGAKKVTFPLSSQNGRPRTAFELSKLYS
ncbi:hypothetical protein EDB85DRAFT_1896491, partial [Lactarius pseudohatsudake]